MFYERTRRCYTQDRERLGTMESDSLEIILKEKIMKVFLVALLLCIGACADKGYEALPNHDHIKCTGKCDVRLK